MTTKVHRPAVPGLALILGALTALGPLSIDLYLPALPDLSRELATAASSVQLTLTACLIGLALGQAIAGPCSDRFGRRRPLLIGVSSYALAALLCTVAPSVELLIAARLIQGLAGGAAIVIARAIVRDLHEGLAPRAFFSTLMQISGVAPILAPLAGGLLLKATSWRGLFLVMAGLSVVLVVAVVRLPETNPGRGDTPMLRTLLRVSAAPTFAGYALVGGLSFAAMFAYIAGSPFVLCEIYGLSPTAFSVVFAVNGLGIIVAGRVANSIQRWSSRTVLAFGVVISVVGGVLAAVAVFANVGLPLLLSGFFLVVASIGVIMPNTVSLALSTVPAAAAGSASALLGLAQFVLGGMIAPMVGIAGPHDARPLVCALVILPCCAALVLARWTGVGGRASGANTVAAAR